MNTTKEYKCKTKPMPEIFTPEWDIWDRRHPVHYYVLHFETGLKINAAGRCPHSAINQICVNHHICGKVIKVTKQNED